jgi:hypothetical protein
MRGYKKKCYYDEKIIDYIYFLEEVYLSLDKCKDIRMERDNLNSAIHMATAGAKNECVYNILNDMVLLLNKILYIERLFTDFPRICNVPFSDPQVLSLKDTSRVTYDEYLLKKGLLCSEIYRLKTKYDLIEDDLPF